MPRMGFRTSATMNAQRKVRRRLRLSVSERMPYVEIEVWLTACSCSVWGCLRSADEGGTTLTSAPVSKKNCIPEM